MWNYLALAWLLALVAGQKPPGGGGPRRLRSRTTGKGKIVDGTPASTDDYPWMASLGARTENCQFDHFCGASVIRKADPAIVLTAAHCVEDIESIFSGSGLCIGEPVTIEVDIGRDDTDSEIDPVYETLDAIAWRMHGLYSFPDNDIALIILDGGVEDYEEISLYERTPLMGDCCETGDDLRVLGYGRTDDNAPPSDTFEFADLQFLDRDRCEKHIQLLLEYYYDGDPNTDPFNANYSAVDWDSITITEYLYTSPGQVCAWDPSSNTCFGDSGGPLISGSTQHDPQIGVVSWVFAGCGGHAPSGYADVGYYGNWIAAAEACLLYDNGYNIVLEKGMSSFELCNTICHYEGGDPYCTGDAPPENITPQ